MKKILFSIFILAITLSCTIGNGNLAVESGKLTGAVTFNEANGSPKQADPGSLIYAISEADVKATPYADIKEVMKNFKSNKTDYFISTYRTIDPVRIKNAQDRFDAVSDFTGKYINGLRKLPAVARVAVNDAGIYTLNLKPGKYIILVVSGTVKSGNTVECKGNIDVKTAEIRAKGETLLDINFEKAENVLMMLLTGWQQEGC